MTSRLEPVSRVRLTSLAGRGLVVLTGCGDAGVINTVRGFALDVVGTEYRFDAGTRR